MKRFISIIREGLKSDEENLSKILSVLERKFPGNTFIDKTQVSYQESTKSSIFNKIKNVSFDYLSKLTSTSTHFMSSNLLI